MRSKTFSLVTVLLLLSSLTLVIDSGEAEPTEPPVIEWNRTYGGGGDDRGYHVSATDDGGYVIAGTTNSFGAGNSDIWLVKTDSAGNMMWNETYGGSNNEWMRYMIQTSDGGYGIVGFTGSGNYDLLFVKTDANGSLQWSQTYGGGGFDQGYSLVEITGDGFAIAGFTDSQGAGNRDFWLIRTDVAGNMLWSQTYGTAGEEIPLALQMNHDGGFALVGSKTASGVEGRDVWLVVTDAGGTMLTNRTYGGSGIEGCQHGHALITTSDGGYAIATYTRSYGAGDYDWWLIKTDSEGNAQWNQTFGGTSEDSAASIYQTADEGYAVAGYTCSFGSGGRDFWLVRLASPTATIADIDVDPDSLNLRSSGEWITACIELPEECDVNTIDRLTIFLNTTISVDPDASTAIGDYDEDGIPDLMVKFDRNTVIAYILGVLGAPNKFTWVALTITGTLDDGTVFEGSDTIKVIYPKSGSGKRLFIK